MDDAFTSLFIPWGALWFSPSVLDAGWLNGWFGGSFPCYDAGSSTGCSAGDWYTTRGGRTDRRGALRLCAFLPYPVHLVWYCCAFFCLYYYRTHLCRAHAGARCRCASGFPPADDAISRGQAQQRRIATPTLVPRALLAADSDTACCVCAVPFQTFLACCVPVVLWDAAYSASAAGGRLCPPLKTYGSSSVLPALSTVCPVAPWRRFLFSSDAFGRVVRRAFPTLPAVSLRRGWRRWRVVTCVANIVLLLPRGCASPFTYRWTCRWCWLVVSTTLCLAGRIMAAYLFFWRHGAGGARTASRPPLQHSHP